jgi:hypothetical protein
VQLQAFKGRCLSGAPDWIASSRADTPRELVIPEGYSVQKVLGTDKDYQRMAREIEKAARLLREQASSGSTVAKRLEGFARRMRENE